MTSASPRPVKPRPTRRLCLASCCCCGSGQTVTSSTLSSMRTATCDDLGEAGRSRMRAFGSNGLAHEARQVDRAQAAAAVGRQRLLGAGIGGLDRLAVVQVVVAVHAVEEQHARLGVVVGRAHDLVPQLARAQLAVDPQAVARAGRRRRPSAPRRARPCAPARRRRRPRTACMKASVTPTEMLKLLQVAAVLGVDELLDVRVVAAQHAHLRAAARAGAIPPSRRSGRTRACSDTGPLARDVRAAHPGAARADATRSRSRRRRRGAWSRRPRCSAV